MDYVLEMKYKQEDCKLRT